ncbi:MAG: phosphotransferase [Methylococcaceae bacterium]|nr:phosphotransferase [Methylococcaceae bacterium]
MSGFDIVSVDVGTTTRVRLEVTHKGSENLPNLWFVKLPSLSWQARAITALPRLLPTEVRFYNELADKVPLKKPKKLFAQSRFGLGSTLVIEDVTEFGAVPGITGEALTSEQARAVVGQLATFHSAFMEKAKHDESLRWLSGPIRRLEDFLGTALAVPLMKRGIKLAKETVPVQLHPSAIHYAKNRKNVMKILSDAPPTLLHHDCHPGNLFWHDGSPGFLDWQMVRIGEGVSDVSYFMATALEPEVRRSCEMDLLEEYHRILCKNSHFKYDFDTLVERYRAHLVYPFEAMVLTLAVGGLMELQSNLAMIRRSAEAVLDHDTFTVLASKNRLDNIS